MGSGMSMRLFEFINDVHILVGSGIFGLCLLIHNGMNTHAFKTLSVAGLTIAGVCYALTPAEILETSKNKVVFITGCDSGLGFSLAVHACELGFKVIAGCLNENSAGAKELIKICQNVRVVELDITKVESVKRSYSFVNRFLDTHPKHVFWALINNAGVMVFGECEWQTENLIKDQIEINLVGTIRTTRIFSPLLRKSSGRVINISSHCASETLPGLSVYGATKAGIKGWSDGIRVELGKYGVKIITFVPGSFIQHSNIMSRQNENFYEMQAAMSQEQTEFYGDYFKQYNSYLSALSGSRLPKKIDDEQLFEVFEKTLLEKYPHAHYLHEPWRYTVYHALFKICPVKLRDVLIERFTQMPKWEPVKSDNFNVMA